MIEINSKTILKSILGQIIHLTQALQIENRIDETKAKVLAREIIEDNINDIIGKCANKRNFTSILDELIIKYKNNNSSKYTLLLQLKDLYNNYEKNKTI